MDYKFPIKTLKNWFDEIVVTRKREEVAQLLVKLLNEKKGSDGSVITLPTLVFPTLNGKIKTSQKEATESSSKGPAGKSEEDIKKKTSEAEVSETTKRRAIVPYGCSSSSNDSSPEGSIETSPQK